MNPLLPTDAMREQLGVGRSNVVWWRTTALALVIPVIGLTGWLAWEIKTEPQIVPYVLILDEETRVLDTIQAKDWVPSAGQYADIARRWIWNVRSVSTDPLANRANLEEAKRMTSKALGPQMQRLADETVEKLKKDGLEVDIVMETDPQIVADGRAVVDVDWRERRYKPTGGAADWIRMSGRVSLAVVPPKNTGEIEANPSGIYVTGFNFQRIVPAGPLAEAQR